MKTIEKILPAGFRFRELWLPEVQNNSATIPSAVAGGHKLTHTGARNGTTSDGVHFDGSATSNAVITAAAGQNDKAAFHITIRFKLDQAWTVGGGTKYLFIKGSGADLMALYLNSTDGKLTWWHRVGGSTQFMLAGTTTSWVAGTWYTVTASFTDAPAQRLLVNGVLENSSTAAAANTTNGGDIVLCSSSDGGTDGVVGVVSLICIGVGATATIALTTAQETDLYNGIAPVTAKVQYLYLFDEGSGVTLVDRSATAANATLDTACTWAFGKCKQALISFPMISGSSVATSTLKNGSITDVVIIKAKATYNAPSVSTTLFHNDGSNHALRIYCVATQVGMHAYYQAAGTVYRSALTGALTIGNYYILSFVVDASAKTFAAYLNGALLNSQAVDNVLNAVTDSITLGDGEPSGVLSAGRVEGAMTAAQLKQFHRTLDQFHGCGIGV